MPANKNALIRYKTIDNCLRNRYRRWTLDDLVQACSDALYEAEGIRKGVSMRTVQGDIQLMRSDKLGYNAPIEVYDHKYYRYADDDYSITAMPLSQNDYDVLQEAVNMLRELEDFEQFSEMADVVSRLQDRLSITRSHRKPIIHFDSVPQLKGLRLLNPLYNYIAHRQTVRILYQPFSAAEPIEIPLFPYLLKEFRNRWFLFGSRADNMFQLDLPLDRIVEVTPMDITYRHDPDFDSEHFFDDLIGVSKSYDSSPVKIRFWASGEQSNYIKTKPIHISQRLLEENPTDHSCIFQIEVVVNYEMYSVFMSYGPGVKLLSPEDVVARMHKKVREMAALYST